MKKNKRITLASALILISLSMVSAQATADVVLQGGGVTITETDDGLGGGEYIVDNGSASGIFGFGVSNNTTNSVSTGFAFASDGVLILWDSAIVSETNWATHTIINPLTFNEVTLGSFGAFTDFFETGDSVNFYSFGETGIINPGASVNGAFFFSPDTLESSAVVFNVGGGATALTSVVPVPAAVWLFGSGLVGLIGVARRKKA